MRTIKVVIAEDDPRNIAILKRILEEECENVEVAGIAQTVQDAVAVIKETKPDAFFLDIEMPPHKGFEILEAFPKIDFDVIFTTAHEEYAIQAIKFSALDYLLKPLAIEDVKQALERVNHRDSGKTNELVAILKEYLKEQEPDFSKIVIPTSYDYTVIDLKDIIFCEACDSYTKIHTKGKVHLISKPLKQYDEMLSDKGFHRIHKSFLINVNHIRKIIKGVGAAVIMSDETNIPISIRRKDDFFKNLKGIIRL